MSDKERLGFLLSYHRNLTLQLTSAMTISERNKLNNALVNLENEIETLLYKNG